MKLVGVRRDRGACGSPWTLDGAVSPIAEVDDFYSDVRGVISSEARGG